MPNHVINELNFIGEQKDIDKILSLIHDETDEQHLERCRQMWGYDPKDEEYQ